MSDFYRQKLYAAERAAFREQPNLGRTIEEVQARADEVARTSSSWRGACTPYQLGRGPVKIVAGKGRSSYAYSGEWKIALTASHRGQDWVLLHEMSHLPTSNLFQAHGREFCALYLEIVREEYGEELADRLRSEMKARGVPYERDARYVRQLRGYLRAIERTDSYDVRLIMRDGATSYYGAVHLGDDDVVYLSRSYSGSGTPDSVRLEDVAYVTWKVQREPKPSWWEE